MPKTISEKILGEHAGRGLVAGDIAVVDVDVVMAQDGTGPLAEQSFSVNGPQVLDMKGEIGMSAVVVPMAQL